MRNKGGRIIFILVVAGLLAGTAMFIKNFKTTPSGSLYYLGKAIYNRDSDLFCKYIDFDRIISHFEPDAQAGGGILAGLARQAFAGLNEQGVTYIRQIIEDPKRSNLPGSLVLLLGAQQGVEENGLIEVMLPAIELGMRPLHFTMARYPEQTWKVVEINSRDLEWLLLGYLGISMP